MFSNDDIKSMMAQGEKEGKSTIQDGYARNNELKNIAKVMRKNLA